MASTLLVRNLLWQVSTLLEDATPQFTRWQEEELVRGLNLARRAICKYLPSANSKVAALRLSSGTLQSIDTIAPANIKFQDGTSPAAAVLGEHLLSLVRNMGADGSTPGRAIRLIDREDLDAVDPGWHLRAGSVVRNYLYDPMTPKAFWVSPGVEGDVWVQGAIALTPDETVITTPGQFAKNGASNATIGLDDKFEDDLIAYLVGWASGKDSKYADPAKRVEYSNRFVSSINAQVQTATGVNPNLTRLPFSGEPVGAAR